MSSERELGIFDYVAIDQLRTFKENLVINLGTEIIDELKSKFDISINEEKFGEFRNQGINDDINYCLDIRDSNFEESIINDLYNDIEYVINDYDKLDRNTRSGINSFIESHIKFLNINEYIGKEIDNMDEIITNEYSHFTEEIGIQLARSFYNDLKNKNNN